MPKTLAEINEKIKKGVAVVLTAEEIIPLLQEKGSRKVAQEVDVVTTGTFGAMCSSGAFLNFGHSDPPLKMNKLWLNQVPAYGGIAAVDAYIGATEVSESLGDEYGGAHVICDLVAGRPVKLQASGRVTDCYPGQQLQADISLATLNQAYLFNPRNAYQNYVAATNSSTRTLNTYMGTLLPKMSNINYSSAGQLSPLLNDPDYRTIGVGTRIFLGGGIGYVAWEGTQHNPSQVRGDHNLPLGPAGTLALIGDLRGMDSRFLRACTLTGYGPSLMVGVGIPIPILDEDMACAVGVSDGDIRVNVVDFAVGRRSRPTMGQFSYAELRSGWVELEGRRVRAGSLSSYAQARAVADELKRWIQQGDFTLQEAAQALDQTTRVRGLEGVVSS